MVRQKVIIIRNASPFDFGGGERYPIFVSSILKDNDFDPIIISGSKRLLEYAKTNHIQTMKGWWWKNQNWSSWRVILFPVYVAWQFILTLWYLSVFIREKPGVVHIHSKDDFIAGTFAAKIIGIRVVWTDYADLKHIWLNLSTWYKNPVGKFVYISAFLADAITVVSKSEQHEITAHLSAGSGVREKIVVIYNGCFDVRAAHPKKLSENKITYSIANRLVTDKGLRETIGAFIAINKKHSNTELLIIGDGPEASIFKKQAEGCSAIKFVGFQNEPFDYINQSDIFLQPTYHEGFSVALVEACMLEMPIIATNVGGNVEIIDDNENGLLVKSRDTDSLHEAMEKLYNDKPLRLKLARNARKTYEDGFTIGVLVKDHYIPVYLGKDNEKN